MVDLPTAVELPATLGDVDAAFMTRLLRTQGVIGQTNAVTAIHETDVGMTAGYFSAIKRVRCTFAEPTDASASYIVKTWPELEIMPKENIASMFARDINAYSFAPERFFPRPLALLADYDAEHDRWALVMEDADTFADHKVHEEELTIEDVMRLIPRMVDVAVAWEGCDVGDQAQELDRLGVGFWTAEENLASFRAVMPGGAKLFDKLTTLADSPLVGRPTWDEAIGPGIAELLTRKLGAFFDVVRPERGATCVLAHGDFRGDNLFFCAASDHHPDGWLVIDFQQMFRGPVPSDLAYLMSSGTVLPEVYEGDGCATVLRAFYDQYMVKTVRYPAYTWEQFRQEYAVMTTILFTYYVGFGATYWQAGAYDNELPLRVELGGRGATLDELTPEDLRKRMWWAKSFRNFRTNFVAFDQYAYLQSLPDDSGEMGPWAELPDHLR